MSPSSTSTVRKRKATTKTKEQQQAQQTENNLTMATTTTTTAAAASNKTKTMSATDSAGNNNVAPNERLQRNNISDKLDFNSTILQQQLQLQLQHNQQQQHFSAFKLCNGITGVVQCCRDINCQMNASMRHRSSPNLPGSMSTLFRDGSVSTVASHNSDASSSSRSSSEAPQLMESKSHSSTPVPSLYEQQQQQQQKNKDLFSNEQLASSSSSAASNADLAVFFIPRSLVEREFTINFNVDIFSWLLFLAALLTRFYRLATPPYVVFDELHYAKYVSFYMRHVFFYDQHPPLGKQLIAAAAHFAGYDGNNTFSQIGAEYGPNVPVFWLRFVPALCGSLLPSAVYKLLLVARLNRWTALLGGLLVVCDNALLTQSRFVLMESMLLLFSTLGLYCLVQFQHSRFIGARWLVYCLASACLLTCAASIKYAGFFSGCLAGYLMCRYVWELVYHPHITDWHIFLQALTRILVFTLIPIAVYLGIFYIHLAMLHRAGPHDSAMTSAFQASLDGGLASITRSQPLNVVHGSQITLRHTHGRTCWLHSHPHVYPVRYPDKRGSSHQQQVTCYSFKDVNNWWIVKRPERDDLIADENLEPLRDGDVIQLVHGITSRALNSHDVAAPMTPQCQEVSCYIDYQIKMSPELLWRIQILNKDTQGPIWRAIKSEIRLIHESTGAALRFSGRLLPEWGFNQHEVVADRTIENQDAIWNVEEHRYTKTQDHRERERQLRNAEMIPTKKTKLSFWDKFVELQAKMLWHSKLIKDHMYSSTPLEWPLLDKGIAYWMDSANPDSNSQIHLLGNILIWYSSTFALLVYAALFVFYILRRRRLCYDIPPEEWLRFVAAGDLFFVGYLMHYIPYFVMDRTLFLHHYLPALLFKVFLLCFVVEHVDYLLRRNCGQALWMVRSFRLGTLIWLACVVVVFVRFFPLSYGMRKMSNEDVLSLRWKDTWDFILQKRIAFNFL